MIGAMKKHPVVREEMTEGVICVRPSDSIQVAFCVMQRAKIRHLPVLDGSGLVGMLSDRDIFRHSEARGGELVIGKTRVDAAMTRGVRTCRDGDRIGDVVDTMLTHGIDALPVADDSGAVLGIVTSTDCLRYLRRIEGVLDVGALVEARNDRDDGID